MNQGIQMISSGLAHPLSQVETRNLKVLGLRFFQVQLKMWAKKSDYFFPNAPSIIHLEGDLSEQV